MPFSLTFFIRQRTNDTVPYRHCTIRPFQYSTTYSYFLYSFANSKSSRSGPWVYAGRLTGWSSVITKKEKRPSVMAIRAVNQPIPSRTPSKSLSSTVRKRLFWCQFYPFSGDSGTAGTYLYFCFSPDLYLGEPVHPVSQSNQSKKETNATWNLYR